MESLIDKSKRPAFPDEILLEMNGIRKTFGPVVALNKVDIKVKRGNIHAICGENGAGKSTLMNVLSGVYPHGTYGGEIRFEGRSAKYHSLRDSEKDGVVIIHQELALSPFLSIAENIFLGNEQKVGFKIDWNATRSKALAIMKKVGLDENPDTPISQIGVGKQQLVEIAKAMSKNVKLLILDEPTSALNDDDSLHLLQLIENLRDEEGISSIIISHKLNEIGMIADEVTIIRDGESVGDEIIVNDAHPLDENALIARMVGRSLDNRYPEHESKTGETLLEVKNWTVYHPEDTSRKVVGDLNIEVRAGEIVGLAGLMGSGRTEFAMSLFGKSYGVGIHGEVKINGQQVALNNVGKAIQNGLGYVSEDRKIYGLNLLQNIRENTSIAGLDIISKFGIIDKNREIIESERLRKQMRTKTPSIEANVGTLSGGNQQKVVFSKWLFTKPEILILDEPTRGIDVGAKYEIYETINALADDGKAIIVISSELPEILGICDRIYTISFGKVTGCFDRSESTQESLMKYMTK
ncbi:MAG: sugar ABC transporter ATP-binding protein [Clostridiales Family XIII bacterium]|jgi:putative multiple sugar transport system ATP-binding protein|nr:sugar ABC transporter ATP-binding protein [Clostridiales Family XIII bacterium]